jgi:Ca-activated chloride channel family protein
LEYFFRFEQLWILFITVPLLVGFAFFRQWYFAPISYSYSLGEAVKSNRYESKHPYKKILYVVRLFFLLLLALLVAKPQLVDSRSNMLVDGIDIMLVLDASGSMQYQDYSDDERSRFEVAQEEAIRFSKKRMNDAVGLVLFAKDAISRCPLTLDKKIIHDMVSCLKLGDIDPDGTMLATAVVTAVNRLKHSSAKSKIMILLTDGEPSPGDMSFNAAIEIAKKFNIKVYAVGIGSDQEGIIMHPFYGMIAKPKVNSVLLQQIAHETGGMFFMARDEHDMREVYETIDCLEKTKHETPLYSRYFDVFIPILLISVGLLFIEQILSSFIWFSV